MGNNKNTLLFIALKFPSKKEECESLMRAGTLSFLY